MRRTLAALLLTCLVTLLGLLTANPAAACSCVPQTTQQYFARADAVFTASLVSREEPRGHVSSADPAVHVFAVETVYKGTALESQEVLSPVSGATCGLELGGAGPFVVFASRSIDLGGTPTTALPEHQYASLLCDGSGALTPELEAELAAFAPSGPRSATPGVEIRDDDAGPVGAWLLLAVSGAVVLLGGGALLARRSTGSGTPPPPAPGPGSAARRDG